MTPVHLPGDVYCYMVGKIRGVLPALAEPDPAATGGMTGTLAGALRALTETRTGRGSNGIDRGAREPKTIQEANKKTYRTLLRYGNVTEVESVVPIWNRLANASKSEYHTIMMQEFQRMCMACGLSTDIYTPVVTTGLKQIIVGFQFVGHGVDDLRSGCQPFQVAYAGSASHYCAVTDASVSNQLAQGKQNASLADYRTIRDQEKIKFPRDITEVCITRSDPILRAVPNALPRRWAQQSFGYCHVAAGRILAKRVVVHNRALPASLTSPIICVEHLLCLHCLRSHPSRRPGVPPDGRH